jgi:hypothetical protein
VSQLLPQPRIRVRGEEREPHVLVSWFRWKNSIPTCQRFNLSFMGSFTLLFYFMVLLYRLLTSWYHGYHIYHAYHIRRVSISIIGVTFRFFCIAKGGGGWAIPHNPCSIHGSWGSKLTRKSGQKLLDFNHR